MNCELKKELGGAGKLSVELFFCQVVRAAGEGHGSQPADPNSLYCINVHKVETINQ